MKKDKFMKNVKNLCAYALDNKDSKQAKFDRTEGEINIFIIIIGDFNILLPEVSRTSGLKIRLQI